MLKLVDATALTILIFLVVRAFLVPEDPLWFAGIATLGCFWLACRVVVIETCGNRMWPAPGLMFLLLCMVSNHLGGFFHYYTHIYTPPEAAWKMIWAFNLAYLGFAAGTFIISRGYKSRAGEKVDRYYSQPFFVPENFRSLVLPAAILFLIGVGFSLVIMRGQLPILTVIKMILTGRVLDAAALAVEARALLHTASEYRFQGYVNQVRIAVLPMIAILWFVTYRITRQKVFMWLSAISIGIAALLLVGVLERSGLIFFIIQLIIAGMLLYRPKLSIKWLYYLAGMFAAMVGLSLLLGRGATTGGLAENLIWQVQAAFFRIYGSNSLSSAKTFELFPQYLDFRWGMTWLLDLRNLLPGPGSGLSREVYQYIFSGSGTAGVHFISEMWANGGYMVVALASLVTGMVMHWASMLILERGRRTPLGITLTCLMSFTLAMLGMGGFMTPINRGLFSYLILFGVFSMFVKIGKGIKAQSTISPVMLEKPS